MLARWLLCCSIVGLTASATLLPVSSAQDKEKKKPTLTREEKRLIELTNLERKKKNLPALKANLALSEVARAHSQNMAKHQKLVHTLDGKTAFQRIKASGYRYHYAGENVGWGNYPIEKIFAGWIKSPPHYANIMKKEYTDIGMGRFVDGKGNSWYTQIFAKPQRR